jgi:tryptophan synthase beta chain
MYFLKKRKKIMKTKILLDENELSTHFLNLNYYLKKYLGKVPEPALHPGTKKPVVEADLESIFARELVKQELSIAEKIEIPEELQEIYKTYRNTPLIRAKSLEKFLKTPAQIYFKNEGATLSGNHKINTALAQAYYNSKEGIKTLVTETGAGQWGSALSLACKYFNLKCQIFMVKVSYDQKPYRKYMMQIFGGQVFASPSQETEYGRSIFAKDPNCTGSLGMAISEALEIVGKSDNTKYCLGSVLNHVLLHQTIVGQETKKQLEKIGIYPDMMIGCVGGGSNFSGFIAPFVIDKISGKHKDLELVGVEPTSCPKMTKGEYRYDFGDSACKTPLLKMETLGNNFIPSSIHAGGLRYHANAPILSFLNQEKITRAVAYNQLEVFEAAIIFAKTQGIVVAPETAHAIKATVDEAIKCRESGQKKVIVFNLSGLGYLDLEGYNKFLKGELK